MIERQQYPKTTNNPNHLKTYLCLIADIYPCVKLYTFVKKKKKNEQKNTKNALRIYKSGGFSDEFEW